jgi:hypothetical protein
VDGCLRPNNAAVADNNDKYGCDNQQSIWLCQSKIMPAVSHHVLLLCLMSCFCMPRCMPFKCLVQVLCCGVFMACLLILFEHAMLFFHDSCLPADGGHHLSAAAVTSDCVIVMFFNGMSPIALPPPLPTSQQPQILPSSVCCNRCSLGGWSSMGYINGP